MGEPGTSSPRHHAAAAAAVTAGGGRFLRPVRPTAEALAIRGPSPARRDDDNDPDRCRSGGGAAGERAARGDRRASREAEVGAPWRAEQRGGGDDWAGGGGRASVLREERPGGRQTLGGARQENGVRRAQPPGEDEGEPRKWKRWEARSPAQEDAGRQEGRRPALSPLERPRGQDTLMEADSPPREGSRSFQRRGTDGSLQEEPAAQARRGWAKSLHEDARRCERRAAVPAAAAAGIPAFEKSRSQERFFDSDGPLRAEPRKWEKWVEAGGSLREGSRRWERQAIAGGSVREKSRIWERLIEAESPALEKSRSQSRPIEVNGSPREESRTWRGRIAIERFLREEEEEPGTKGLRGSAGHRLGEPRGLERQGASTSLHEDSRRWKRQAAAGVPLVEKSSDDDKRLHLESLLSDEAKGRARQAEAGGPLREGSSGSRRGVEAVLHDEPVTRGQRVLAGHALEEPRGVERRGVSSSLHEDSGRWKRQAAAGFPLVEKSREWERRMDPDGPPGELFRSSRRTGATESFLQEEPTVQGKRGSVISLSEEPRRWEVRAAAAARIPVLEKSRSPEGLFDSDSPLHAGPRRWEKRVEAGGSLREESNRWKRQASPWGSIRDKSRQWETEADSSPEPRKGTDNPMESVGRARVAQPSIRRPSQTTGDQPGSPEKLPRRDLEVLGSPRPGMLPARMRLAMLREKLAAEGMILQDSKMLRRKSSVSTGNGNQSPGTGVPAGQDSPSAKESEEAEAATKIGTGAETKTRIETRTETGTRTRTRTDTETKADTKARIETRPETATKAETKTGTRTGTAIEAQAEFSRGVKMRSGFASEGDRDRGQRSNHGVGVREETAPTTSRTADLCSPTEDVVKQSARRIIGDYLTQPRPIHKPLHANDDGGGPEDAPREAKARPSGESGSGSPATSNEGVHGGGVGAPHGQRAAEADVPGSRASRPTDDRSAAAAAHSGRRYRNGETPSPSRGEREGGTLNGSAGRAAAASEGCPGGPADASDDSVGEGKIGREGKVGGRGSLAPKEESHVEGQGSLYRKVGLRGHGQMVGTEEVGRQEEGAGHEELAYRKGHFKGPALGHLEGPALSNKEGLTFPQEGLREKDLGNVREGLRHVDGGERKEVRDHNMEGSTYHSEDKEGLKKEHLKAESPTSKQEGLSDQRSPKDNGRAKANRTEKTWVKSLQADDEGLVVPVRRRLRYEEELIASNDLDYKVKDAGDPEGQVDTKSQDVGTKEDLSDEEAEDKDSSRYKACLVHVHVQPECNREDELRGRDQMHTGDGLSKGELVIDRRDPEITQRDVNRVGGSDSEKEDQAIGGDDESRRGYGLMGEEGEEEEQRPSYEREDDAHKRDGAGDSRSLTGDAQGMGDDYKQRASTMEDQMAKEGFTGGEDVGLSHKNTWAHAMDKKSLANKTRSLDDGHTFKASVYNEQRENEDLTGGDDLGLRFNKVWVSDGENRGLTRKAQSLDDGHTFKVSVYNEQRENEDLTGGDDLGLRFNKVWVSDGENRGLTRKAQSLDDGHTFKVSVYNEQRGNEDLTGGDDLGLRFNKVWVSDGENRGLTRKTQSLDDGHTFKASVYNEQRENEDLTGGDDLGLRFNKVWVSDGENRGLTRKAQSLDDGHTFKASVYNEQRENEDLTGGDDLGLRFNKVWVSDGEDRGLTGKAPSLDDGHTFQASTKEHQRENEGLTGGDDLRLGHKTAWAHDMDTNSRADHAHSADSDLKHQVSPKKNKMEEEGSTDGDDLGLSRKNTWAHGLDTNSLAGNAPSPDDGHRFKASMYEDDREKEGLTGGDDLGLGHKGAWVPAIDTHSPADSAHSPDSDYKHQASTKENQTEKEGSIDGDDLGLSYSKVWTHDPENRGLTGKAQSLYDGYTFQESTRDDLRDREGFTDPRNVGPRHESDWARGTPQPREDDGERLPEEGSEPFIGEGPSDGNGGFEPKRGADRGEVKVDNNGTSNDGPGNGTSNSILRRSFGHSSSAEEEPAFQDEDGFGIDGGGGDDWDDVTARTPWRHPHGGDDENAKPENVHNGGSGYEAPGENSDGEARDDDDQKSDAGHSAAGPASANAGSIPVFRRPRLADDDRTALENLDDGRPLPDGNKSRDSDSANYRIGSRENDFIGSGESHGRAEPLNENAARLNGGTAALNGTGLDNLPQTLDPLKDVDGTVVADEGRGGIGASGRANGADAPGAAPGQGDAASRGDSGSTSGASSQQWVDYFVDSGSPDHDDVHGTYAHVPIGGPAGGGRAAPRDDGTNPFLFVHDAVAQEVDADGRAGRGIWSALFAGGKPCAGRFFEGPDDDLENLPDWLRSIGPSPNPLPLPRSSRDRPPHQKHWQLYKFLPPIKEEVEIRTRPPPIIITPPAAITLTAATAAAAQKTPDMIPPALASNAAGSPLLPRTPTFDKYKPHENFSAIVSNSKQSYLDMISKIKTRPSRFAKDGVYFQSKDGFGKLPMTKRKNYGYSFSRSMDSAEDLEEKSPAEEQVARED
ncbi:uncharacterized protein LOC116955542 [Petromyzon marinus]|uniref:uncharacterized protein LOC116955542 n=1 Tax=Petromyzon marinus TaxID=7757 RepID=UPI003F6FDF38